MFVGLGTGWGNLGHAKSFWGHFSGTTSAGVGIDLDLLRCIGARNGGTVEAGTSVNWSLLRGSGAITLVRIAIAKQSQAEYVGVALEGWQKHSVLFILLSVCWIQTVYV